MEDLTYMNDRGAPPDYYSQVARRRVPGASLYGGLGRYVATGAVSRQIVWADGAYVLTPSTGLQMTYVSTSANDAAAGTGARVLEVHYLDTLLKHGGAGLGFFKGGDLGFPGDGFSEKDNIRFK